MAAPIPVFSDRPKAASTPKLRALVKFPGNVEATTGIEVTKQNGTYTFETDWTDFGAIDAIPTSPSSFILTFDTVTGVYVLCPSHLLGGAVAGIADVTTPGTYARTTGNWVEVAFPVSITDFGAIGTDITIDNTTAIQNAVNSGARVVNVPAGVFSTSQVNIPSNVTLTGVGTIRRKDTDIAITGLLVANFSSNVTIDGITIDGNKAHNAGVACSVLVGASGGSSGLTIRNCTIKDNVNSGIAIIDSQDNANNTKSIIANNLISGHGESGVSTTRSWNISILDNLIESNTNDGVTVSNLVYPPVSEVDDQIIVSGNRCLSNGRAGITFQGFYEGGTSDKPVFGNGVPANRCVTVSNNICNFNSGYGIAVYGWGIAVTGNICRRNGITTPAPCGGINCASLGAIISGNHVDENYYWGIDIGGSEHTIVSNNYIGNTSSLGGNNAIGLNFGATVNCTAIGNILENNHTPGGVGTAITATSVDSGGGSYFPTQGKNLTLANNKLYAIQAGAVGLVIADGFDNLQLLGNSADGFGGNNAFILRGGAQFFSVIERDNIDWQNGGIDQIINSDASSTWVVPEIGKYFRVGGTTAPANIYTASASLFLQQVFAVRVLSGGSGYALPPLPGPTVSFSGGGGSGAAANALVTNAGHVVGVKMSSGGSGYTSPPTVSFSSGTATADCFIGCNNSTNREIVLGFAGAMTLTTTGNIYLKSSYTTTAGISQLTLRSLFGNWYEVSRSG